MLALLLAADLATVTNSDVQMKLTAVKSKILVGEFTKMRLHWTALKPAEILVGAEELLIDGGTGFEEHLEARLAIHTSVKLPALFQPGEDILTEYVIGLEHVDAPAQLSGLEELAVSLKPAFSHAGRYRIKVKYTQAESNEVEIEVVAPSGRDAELFQELYKQPAILTWMVDNEPDLSQRAERLIGQYGPHPYLARTIRELLAILDLEDLQRLQAMDFSQSAFADEHLLYIAEHGGNILGDAFQRRTLQQIIERFPESLAARQADDLLKRLDTEAPTLSVTASPSTLVPSTLEKVITVAVSVSDDKDPNPAVKLESITCADTTGVTCTTPPNVADANFGTDDREFSLLTGCPGGSTASVYTITYSATDASGHKTTATTTVTMPAIGEADQCSDGRLR